MRTTALTVTMTVMFAALWVAGCASRQDGAAAPQSAPAATSTAPAATTQGAPRIAAPVGIPVASSRKVVMTMTGSRQVVEARDWADFKREWRDTFTEHARTAGIVFTFAEGDTVPQGAEGTLLRVNVEDYRMVGIGARILFGIMTGNAYIDANLKYIDLRDGTPRGEQQYNTRSSAVAGVFAKMTPQQVDAIATEVFADLRSAK